LFKEDHNNTVRFEKSIIHFKAIVKHSAYNMYTRYLYTLLRMTTQKGLIRRKSERDNLYIVFLDYEN